MADLVAQHIVTASVYLDVDPVQAYKHAAFAASRAGRVPAVREIAGITAHRLGKYAEALRELRAAQRMSGDFDTTALIADCQRGLGRPEKVLEMLQDGEADKLGEVAKIEFLMVVAGAYADLGDMDKAVATHELPALREKVDGEWQVRLWVSYSDALTAAGRAEEGQKWLKLAAKADTEQITDAAERLGWEAPDRVLESDEVLEVIDSFDYEAEAEEKARLKEERRAAWAAANAEADHADDADEADEAADADDDNDDDLLAAADAITEGEVHEIGVDSEDEHDDFAELREAGIDPAEFEDDAK
ncbi:hypothetical protein JT358_16990 [Micrococcales bacterium 31B]|nr:hypothetical protein [Micrococcales bacterium 31B]